MSTDGKQELQLEIAHVLFIDIVGYSKLLINEQHESLQELNRIVRNTEAFRAAEAAGKLIRLPKRPWPRWATVLLAMTQWNSTAASAKAWSRA